MKVMVVGNGAREHAINSHRHPREACPVLRYGGGDPGSRMDNGGYQEVFQTRVASKDEAQMGEPCA